MAGLNKTPTKSFKKGLRASKRVSKACNNCKKKKMKCNGLIPCTNCINYKTECSYDLPLQGYIGGNSGQISNNVSKLLANLSSFTQEELEKDSNLISTIDNLNKLLEQTSKKKNLVKDFQNFTLSKETTLSEGLRKNKYSDQNQNFSSFFGLYSHTSMLSQPGFSWFFEKVQEHIIAYNLTIFTQMDIKCFVQTKFLKTLDKYFKLKSVWSESLSILDVMLLEIDKEAISQLINTYYSNPYMNCFVSKSCLLDLTTDFFKDRQSSILNGKFLILFSFILCSLELDPLATKSLRKNYLKICMFIYKGMVFSAKHSFDYLIGLVQFLTSGELNLYPECHEVILAEAINYSFALGLNRKELYVGLTELEADLRRSIMWELYILDKISYLFNTKRIYISDDDISCLYPNSIEAMMSDLPSSLDSMLKKNQFASYMRYNQLRLAKNIFRMHVEFLSSTPSLRLCADDAFNRIFQNFDEIKYLMVMELRPGSKIVKGSLADHDFWSLKLFHLHFFTSLLLLNIGGETQVKKAKSQSGIYDRLKNYALTNLKLFLEIKSYNKGYLLSKVCEVLTANYFQLIYLVIRNPLDADASQIIETLVQVREFILSSLIETNWELFICFTDLYLLPVIQIFKHLHKDDMNLKLNTMIKDISTEELFETKTSENNFKGMEKTKEHNTNIDLDHPVENFFSYLDPSDVFSSWTLDSFIPKDYLN